jgi:hypothetical protein
LLTASVLGALFLTPGILAGAQTIYYSRTFTGADLATEPGIQFFHRTTQVNGTSLDWNNGTTGARWPRLMALALVAAGVIPSNSQVIVEIAYNLTRRTEEYESMFLLRSDSSHYHGIQASDNGVGGSAMRVRYTDADNNNFGEIHTQNTLVSNVGFPAPGGTFTGATTWTLDAASTTVSGGINGFSGSFNTVGLNRSGALSLNFFGDSDDELYRINSLSVQVTGISSAVPEPGTWAALAGIASVGGLAVLRRRRRK